MDLRTPRVWRPRDANIFDFLRRHTATCEQLARLFFSGATLPTRKKKANRWLVRQRKRRRIQVVGFVMRRDTGRPETAYGRRCKLDDLEHEVRLTDFALRYPESPIERDAKVGRTEADGVITRSGQRCFIEIDNSGNGISGVSASRSTPGHAALARRIVSSSHGPGNCGTAFVSQGFAFH